MHPKSFLSNFWGALQLAQPLLYFTVLLYFLMAMLLFPHAFGNKLLYSNYIGL